MDWIIWLVVIVAIVAIVWWLLNRNSSRSSTGSPGAETDPRFRSSPAARRRPRRHSPGRPLRRRSAASASAAGLAWMPTSTGFNQAEPEAEPEPKPDAGATAEDAAAAEGARRSARGRVESATTRPAVTPQPAAEQAGPAAAAARPPPPG